MALSFETDVLKVFGALRIGRESGVISIKIKGGLPQSIRWLPDDMTDPAHIDRLTRLYRGPPRAA